VNPVCYKCQIQCVRVNESVGVANKDEIAVGEHWECPSCQCEFVTNYRKNALVKGNALPKIINVVSYEC